MVVFGAFCKHEQQLTSFTGLDKFGGGRPEGVEGLIANPKEIGNGPAQILNSVGQDVDKNIGNAEKPPPPEEVKPGQMADLLNLVRQAASASERSQQAAKYSEMSAAAAGVAGQQAMIRAQRLLWTREPTPHPFALQPHRRHPGIGIFNPKKLELPGGNSKGRSSKGGASRASMPLYLAFARQLDLRKNSASRGRRLGGRSTGQRQASHWQFLACKPIGEADLFSRLDMSVV
mmetsp:Transcript_120388/g.190765  ORF Transcript_120388/g.190765 Transcript_120388/m.190765 type:complete len:232 (+) Transcript_120388:64-759(+)